MMNICGQYLFDYDVVVVVVIMEIRELLIL